MELIDKIVLPQSANHLILLKYILVLTFLIFIPYASLLFGALSLSIFFKIKGEKLNDDNHQKFSSYLIDLITFNKGIAFSLGIVPLLSFIFCYAQLLHLSNLNVPLYIFASTIIFIISLILIYTYKHSIHLNQIFHLKSFEHENYITLQDYKYKIERLVNKSAYFGLIFLTMSLYLFIASVEFTQNPERWENYNNLWGILFSFNALLSFIQFGVFAFGFTSVFILVKLKELHSLQIEQSYNNFVKNFSLRLALISSLLLPFIIVFSVLAKSVYSLSYNVFSFALLSLLIVLIISVLIYVMIKQQEIKYGFLTISLFIITIAFIVIKDQYAFEMSNKKHFAILAANYEEHKKKLLEESGLLKETINGADIFNSKCIACHQFDRKVVGPPYNDVLPKYENNRQALINFILNPTKINPDYPPMPNQGLKPKEAEAVAEFLMNNYKK
ncbi:MAG: hypothetical protein QHH13_07160 [Melioribacter sp.]|nr:hypothetical protein [Melioribacter sp.]